MRRLSIEAPGLLAELIKENGAGLITPYDDPTPLLRSGIFRRGNSAQHQGRWDAIFVPVGRRPA